MTPKKTRRKAYKNMSVVELVKAREDLSFGIKEIDDILKLAVEALSLKKTLQVLDTNNRNLNLSSNVGKTNDKKESFTVSRNRVGSGSDTDSLPKTNNSNDSNLTTPFTIFDADSWAREEAELSKQKEEVNLNQMDDEIKQLKQEIKTEVHNINSVEKENNNVRDSTAASTVATKDVPTATE